VIALDLGPQFWIRLLEIGFLNLLLSGDNAVLIALAVRSLPRHHRILGQVWGAAGAVALRLVFVGAISALLALGYLVAYHTLGILFFPALLMDLQIPSIEHMRAVMPIFGLLFVLYLMGSFAASMFDKFILSRRIRSR